MTVAELKKELETMPDTAKCFFTLWTSKGRRMFWFNPTYGKKLYEGLNNTTYAQIAYADDCLAYGVFEADLPDGKQILHRIGEKK